MKTFHRLGRSVCLFTFLATVVARAIEPSEVVPIWPGEPPGQGLARGEEKVVPARPRPFYQLTDISKPTLSVYLPPKERRTRTALLILPGGGLQRLAYEHEGLEVAEWAVKHHIAAFLLKYRVPAPATVGTADGQRALSLIRSRAAEWDVDADSIGVIGYSAGGEIAAWMVTHHAERQYAVLDAIDTVSCRPDFAALIYPGGLTARGGGGIKEPIAGKIGPDSPPMFFVHASDDSAENTLAYALALKRARVPLEAHIYRDGGHGFGVRNSGSPVGGWPDRFEDWMTSLGFLDPAGVRNYAREFASGVKGGGKLPMFPTGLTRDDATRAQRRLVREAVKGDAIAGFKGAGITAEARKKLGVDQPLTGVLFRSGRLNAADHPVIDLAAAPDTMVETEVGYLIGVDISYEVLNSNQARDAVQSIVPVIELPVNYTRRGGGSTALDMIASNIGSARYIVGTSKAPGSLKADEIKVRLQRNDQTLHEAGVNSIDSGQWEHLRQLLNQITRAGHTVREGSLIISGALGGPKPAEPGKYTAEFGELGSIEFEVK